MDSNVWGVGGLFEKALDKKLAVNDIEAQAKALDAQTNSRLADSAAFDNDTKRFQAAGQFEGNLGPFMRSPAVFKGLGLRSMSSVPYYDPNENYNPLAPPGTVYNGPKVPDAPITGPSPYGTASIRNQSTATPAPVAGTPPTAPQPTSSFVNRTWTTNTDAAGNEVGRTDNFGNSISWDTPHKPKSNFANGGMVGLRVKPKMSQPGYKTGGKVMYCADGGPIGDVAQDEGKDTIDAKVRPGEYMLNPETVAHVGGGDYAQGVRELNQLVRDATGKEPGPTRMGKDKTPGFMMGGVPPGVLNQAAAAAPAIPWWQAIQQGEAPATTWRQLVQEGTQQAAAPANGLQLRTPQEVAAAEELAAARGALPPAEGGWKPVSGWKEFQQAAPVDEPVNTWKAASRAEAPANGWRAPTASGWRTAAAEAAAPQAAASQAAAPATTWRQMVQQWTQQEAAQQAAAQQAAARQAAAQQAAIREAAGGTWGASNPTARPSWASGASGSGSWGPAKGPFGPAGGSAGGSANGWQAWRDAATRWRAAVNGENTTTVGDVFRGLRSGAVRAGSIAKAVGPRLAVGASRFVPLAAAGGALYHGFGTDTEDYYKRLGWDPVARAAWLPQGTKDLFARSLGVMSDAGASIVDNIALAPANFMTGSNYSLRDNFADVQDNKAAEAARADKAIAAAVAPSEPEKTGDASANLLKQYNGVAEVPVEAPKPSMRDLVAREWQRLHSDPFASAVPDRERNLLSYLQQSEANDATRAAAETKNLDDRAADLKKMASASFQKPVLKDGKPTGETEFDENAYNLFEASVVAQAAEKGIDAYRLPPAQWTQLLANYQDSRRPTDAIMRELQSGLRNAPTTRELVTSKDIKRGDDINLSQLRFLNPTSTIGLGDWMYSKLPFHNADYDKTVLVRRGGQDYTIPMATLTRDSQRNIDLDAIKAMSPATNK